MTVKFTVDGQSVTAASGESVLTAAGRVGVRLPHLCHVPGLPPRSVCRLCLVEVVGMPGYQPGCSTVALSGMEVHMNTEPLNAARKLVMEMILSDHGHCTDAECEIEAVARQVGVDTSRFRPAQSTGIDCPGSDFVALFPDRCVHCDRCIRMCSERQVITRAGRGSAVAFAFEDGRPLSNSACVNCGDCAAICPAGVFTNR